MDWLRIPAGKLSPRMERGRLRIFDWAGAAATGGKEAPSRTPRAEALGENKSKSPRNANYKTTPPSQTQKAKNWNPPPPLAIPPAEEFLPTGGSLSRMVKEGNLALSINVSPCALEESGKVTLGDLSPVTFLGRGSFGCAVLVKEIRTGENLVLKVALRKHVRNCITERDILAVLDHPFVVNFRGAMKDSHRVYYVLEYCCKGDLGDILAINGYLPWKTAQFIATEIAMAVEHIHDKDIVIRDLKPENVLMDDHGHIRLTDFGLSKMSVKGWTFGATTLCGTEPYVAPEMYCWESYGKATDMWALGMVIFEMITGGNINIMRSAGATSAGLDVLGMHLRYHLDGLKWNKVRYTSSAVRALLQRSPYRRLGANGFSEIREHEYFKHASHQWDAMRMRASSLPYKSLLLSPGDLSSEPLDGEDCLKQKLRELLGSPSQKSVVDSEADGLLEKFETQKPDSPVHKYLTSIMSPMPRLADAQVPYDNDKLFDTNSK